MSLYAKESIERVKDAVDMVELVGARSDLRRVGGRYSGLCPFHDERTPSFSVDPEHKLYHCFGCGESGDAIRFVETTESLPFKEAVELLAERYGVELRREREDPREEERRRRRERILTLCERATAYYERILWHADDAEPARRYLAERGLGEEVLRRFRIGFSPDAWEQLIGAAQRQGFSHEELLAAGLAQRGRSGGPIDRFRGRIMFPLADARGRVLGFGARALREDRRPKYLNTAESDVYRKGRQLFGLDRARAAAAKAGRIVAVEGYTDVLALHQAGLEETVAIMGTALTPEQLEALGRAAGRTVYLALDADSAGQEAMLRAGRVARERGVELLVVSMPDGADPADLVAADGAERFRELLSSALSVAEFQARRIVAGADLDSAHGRDRALAELRPLISSLPASSAIRDELVRYVADRLDLPQHLVTALDRPAPTPAAKAPAPTGRPALDPAARNERAFLAMCVARPEVGRGYLERLTPEHLSSAEMRAVRDHLLEHWDDPLAGLDDSEGAALVRDVVLRSGREPVSAEAIRSTFLQLELRRIERGLRRARQDQDLEALRSLAPARQAVKHEIDELIGMAR